MAIHYRSSIQNINNWRLRIWKNKFIIKFNRKSTRHWQNILYAKDPYESKYQYLINKRESVGINHFNDPKAFIDYSNDISKYKNIFAKGYVPNWSEEVFIISKIKNAVPWTYVVNDLNGEEIIESFYEKELQKSKRLKKKEFRPEKVLRKKVINYMSNGKLVIIHLIVGLIKNI